MTKSSYLLDVNVLVALSDSKNEHHVLSTNWFDALGSDSWGTCAFTEAGFIRIMMHTKVGGRTMGACREILARLETLPGYRYWPIATQWNAMIAPFQHRVVGPQQVTDAYLLGLAIQENGILVTLDKGLRYLAGAEYRQHLLLIQ